MTDVKVAKLFRNGGSQAVRLPAEFRFEGDEVVIRRDEKTGNVILSERLSGPTIWDYYDEVGYLDEPIEFMEERPLNQIFEMRNPFADDPGETESDASSETDDE